MSAIRIAIAALVFAAPVAHAEHEHAPMLHDDSDGAMYVARASVVAATYDTMFRGGDYQGAQVGFDWMYSRYGAGAALPLYRITSNGRTEFGLGDAMVHAHVTLAGDHRRSFGLALAVGLPTGDMQGGFGMGHAMVMPAAFASARVASLRLNATVGYGHAFGDHHGDHGTGPIVDPMNQSELTYSASAEHRLARALSVGARLLGAIALGDGTSRTIGAGRASWTAGRFVTSFEVQGGLAGDPFQLRGVVQTAVHF